MRPIRVVVLAFEGVSLFQISVPALAFGVVNTPKDFPAYAVRYCALKPGRVRSDQGLVIEVPDGFWAMYDADIIVAPAWADPEIPAQAELIEALCLAHDKGTVIVGLCLGVFVLGDAGLLDGREATTHWIAREAFARRFPQTIFRPDVLYVADGNVVTSAGTVAAIDCCLQLVRQRHDSEVDNHMARMLVTPPHRQGGQAQYIDRPIPQIASENRLPGVLEWARGHLSEPMSIERLAEVAMMSRRTFSRRFRDATGTTFVKWLNAERVVRAQLLLETTDMPIECVGSEASFGTPLSPSQQFHVHFGTSPLDYPRSFFKTVRTQKRAEVRAKIDS